MARPDSEAGYPFPTRDGGPARPGERDGGLK